MEWYLKVLRQYADFTGRARRKEYWMFALFNAIIVFGLNLVGLAIHVSVLSLLYSLGVLLPARDALRVRRLRGHGGDRAGPAHRTELASFERMRTRQWKRLHGSRPPVSLPRRRVDD